jgi:hypothetical protein
VAIDEIRVATPVGLEAMIQLKPAPAGLATSSIDTPSLRAITGMGADVVTWPSRNDRGPTAAACPEPGGSILDEGQADRLSSLTCRDIESEIYKILKWS